MRVFLDFEASSLSDRSYPVEVAWVFEDGRARSCLLRPAPGWTDWSAEAERIHGLSRRRLEAEGMPVEAVAEEMLDTLSGHRLHASAPSWDGKWLSVLLRAARRPRHALRLGKSDDAFAEAAREILGDTIASDGIATLVSRVIADTEPRIPVHRALVDATLELERYRRVTAAAHILATA